MSERMPRAFRPAVATGPRKRSITIAEHPTSVSLEPVFWTALEEAALDHALPLSTLVALIDAARIRSPEPANLASAIRSWLFVTYCDQDAIRSH